METDLNRKSKGKKGDGGSCLTARCSLPQSGAQMRKNKEEKRCETEDDGRQQAKNESFICRFPTKLGIFIFLFIGSFLSATLNGLNKHWYCWFFGAGMFLNHGHIFQNASLNYSSQFWKSGGGLNTNQWRSRCPAAYCENILRFSYIIIIMNIGMQRRTWRGNEQKEKVEQEVERCFKLIYMEQQ